MHDFYFTWIEFVRVDAVAEMAWQKTASGEGDFSNPHVVEKMLLLR